ncbi:MAG: HEAT repeat domain-containing protein [Planctomycetes bacterium]|nr:HEAT repeat domain-containing protein [Planctomycetota bacterium]
MRIAALSALLLFAFAGCSSPPPPPPTDGFQQPNGLMATEINRRIEQIPYQHRDELYQNLLWLAQTGEQTIPTLLTGLQHENPKVRSSCAWVLGRLGDRRTIPDLQRAAKDAEQTVKLECCRTLVQMGDLAWAPALIEALDSERKEVRFMCHDALKTSTGNDFGYDHLTENQSQMRLSVLRWRQWWSDYSGDAAFAQVYQQRHGLQAMPAMPMGETQGAGNAGNPGSDNQKLLIELEPIDPANGAGASGLPAQANPGEGSVAPSNPSRGQASGAESGGAPR